MPKCQSLDTLIMDLAFAIEDPCGADEIRLARAAVDFVRRVAPENRKNVAIVLDNIAKESDIICRRN